jgi:hypothetical protein
MVATQTQPAAPAVAPSPASRVQRLFRKRTGERLSRTPPLPDWDQLTSHVFDKFSAFTIFVVKKDVAATTEQLAAPKAGGGQTSEPVDAAGILWTKTCPHAVPCKYAATKRFGANIVLIWQAGLKKGTTVKWDRIAAVLTEVTKTS